MLHLNSKEVVRQSKGEQHNYTLGNSSEKRAALDGILNSYTVVYERSTVHWLLVQLSRQGLLEHNTTQDKGMTNTHTSQAVPC